MNGNIILIPLPHPKVLDLSQAELDVLLAIADGLNSKEISVKMRVKPKSIDNYKNRIAKKLELQGYGLLRRFATDNKEHLQCWLVNLLGGSE